MNNSKKLISDVTIEAYRKRFLSMNEHKFSEKGNNLFIEKVIAESEQIENLHVKAIVNEFKFENDEPKSLGGFNKAPRPIETFLASLANCLEVSCLLYFSFSNLNVSSVKVRVEASIDKRSVMSVKEAPLPGLYDFKCIFFIETDEEIKKINNIIKKVEKYCPIRGTLVRSNQFSQKIVLNNKS